MKVLVTGAAGFIGHFVALRLLREGWEVVGVDSVNDYYTPNLKWDRLREAGIQGPCEPGERRESALHGGYRFLRLDLTDKEGLLSLFRQEKFERVCHLAAQAGVRYSLVNPDSYLKSNLEGFLNLLECCRHNPVAHLVYASSSSVYGFNKKMPFSEEDNVDHPVSLYAATKKSNELLAHAYSHLYHIPTTGLRFFTVYGPLGRPDMAPILFAKAIAEGKAIRVFNFGKMKRDFTYIDDIVEGVIRVLDKPATPDAAFDAQHPLPHTGRAPYRIFNIGNSDPVPLMDFITAIEAALGMTAQKHFLPLQAGDVTETFADTRALDAWVGFKPATTVNAGVGKFVDWYRQYYGR